MVYKIGCLGAARIAAKALCHPAKCVAGVDLVGIAARDQKRAEAFAQTHGCARVYADYSELIADPDIQLVYNPLPIHLHADWTIRALQAGKHVLCEKPFAMHVGQARQMVEAADVADRRLIEAFHYRYHPAFVTALDWVRGGHIGVLQKLRARFTVPIGDAGGTEIRHLPETGGGAFMDLGTYPLHWVRQIIGTEAQSYTATATTTARGVDETLDAELDFGNGVVAELHASMALNTTPDAQLEIIGETGRIVFQNPVAPHQGAVLKLITPQGEQTAPISPISTYTYQLSAVVTALDTGQPLPTEAADSIAQQAALDAIYEAAGLGHLRQAM